MRKLLLLLLLVMGCQTEDHKNTLKFATSADYPPFEYYVQGNMTGFDIELGQAIADILGKKAVFSDMQFSAILAALQNGSVDAAISTLTRTPEREKHFDFSDTYYMESLSMVFPKDKPLIQASQFSGKKIACQLGSTMEIWLKKHCPDSEVIAMDNNNQAIEALKAGHVEGVFIDSIQGSTFSQKNPSLAYTLIAQSDTGYAIVMPQHSPLTKDINRALILLKEKGELTKLTDKWLKHP
jgi:polar amino acid transport system substrate-binding protein